LVGQVLNHKNSETTAVYARLAQENVRKALEVHGKKIVAAGVGSKPGKVLKFRSG